MPANELPSSLAIPDGDDGLERLLVEGIYSGPGIEVTPEYIRAKKESLTERRAPRPDTSMPK